MINYILLFKPTLSSSLILLEIPQVCFVQERVSKQTQYLLSLACQNFRMLNIKMVFWGEKLFLEGPFFLNLILDSKNFGASQTGSDLALALSNGDLG